MKTLLRSNGISKCVIFSGDIFNVGFNATFFKYFFYNITCTHHNCVPENERKYFYTSIPDAFMHLIIVHHYMDTALRLIIIIFIIVRIACVCKLHNVNLHRSTIIIPFSRVRFYYTLNRGLCILVRQLVILSRQYGDVDFVTYLS